MIKKIFKTVKKSFSNRYISTIAKEIIDFILLKKEECHFFKDEKRFDEYWIKKRIIDYLLEKHSLTEDKDLFEEFYMTTPSKYGTVHLKGDILYHYDVDGEKNSIIIFNLHSKKKMLNLIMIFYMIL
jgi:hypothetical protein